MRVLRCVVVYEVVVVLVVVVVIVVVIVVALAVVDVVAAVVVVVGVVVLVVIRLGVGKVTEGVGVGVDRKVVTCELTDIVEMVIDDEGKVNVGVGVGVYCPGVDGGLNVAEGVETMTDTLGALGVVKLCMMVGVGVKNIPKYEELVAKEEGVKRLVVGISAIKDDVVIIS